MECRRIYRIVNINLLYLILLSTNWQLLLPPNGRYSAELLEKVREMAEGIEVEDAPVFKTRDEIVKKQQVRLHILYIQLDSWKCLLNGRICWCSFTDLRKLLKQVEIDQFFHYLLHDEGSAAQLTVLPFLAWLLVLAKEFKTVTCLASKVHTLLHQQLQDSQLHFFICCAKASSYCPSTVVLLFFIKTVLHVTKLSI